MPNVEVDHHIMSPSRPPKTKAKECITEVRRATLKGECHQSQPPEPQRSV